MSKILSDRGHAIETIYIDTVGKQCINGSTIEITNDTHFPLYVMGGQIYENFKDLISAPIPDEALPSFVPCDCNLGKLEDP